MRSGPANLSQRAAAALDLLVRHGDRSHSIIDFKAGWGNSVGEVSSLPGVQGYASQLGAYACPLLDGGMRIRGLGLLYVGMPAFARCALD